MRFSTVAIIVLLILLTFFAGFTIYGDKVGNFVVNVKNEELKLSLSVKEDISERTERLTFDGVSALSDTTYEMLPDNLYKGLGSKSVSGAYTAYGFYLTNESERDVDYVMDLKITGVVKDPLPIIRVMLIEGERNTFDKGNRIFALAEASADAKRHLKEELEKRRYYETEPFDVINGKIFSIKVRDLEKGGSQKYTLVIWIEGCDIECVDSRIGSRIKLQLDITAY